MTVARKCQRPFSWVLAAVAGMLAAGCDIFYPPWLANGYPETVVLRSRQVGETSEFRWTLTPGNVGVHRKPGTVYDRIEVLDAEGTRLQVFEGAALEEGCRAAATNAAFPAILFEPAGTRWLSKKEYRVWREDWDELRKERLGRVE
jgi:hypothetical protein